MRAFDLYQSGMSRLQQAEIPDAEIESSLLVGYLLNLSRTQIILHEEELTDQVLQKFEELLLRRLRREPLAYILEEQEFWSLPFHVNNNVLIPRPETELLLEIVIQVLKGDRGDFTGSILDMGTGSGVIPIVLALELPRAFIASLDISFEAQMLAKKNTVRHSVNGRVSFITSDWLNGIRKEPLFDAIVSNPPYVARESFSDLQPEVSQFEPRLALDGGNGGLEVINSFVDDLGLVLKPGGRFFMEFGADQADRVMDIFSGRPEFASLTIYEDYSGHPRIFHARKL